MIFSINHVWNNNSQKKWKIIIFFYWLHMLICLTRQVNISIYMSYRYRYTCHIVTDYLHIYMAVQDRKKQQINNCNFMHIIFILNIKEKHTLTYWSVIRMNYNITTSVLIFANLSMILSKLIFTYRQYSQICWSHLWLIKENFNSLNFFRYNPYTIKSTLLECTTQ